ncbi:lipocalin-like domain-containing protein [Paenibacillus amylolyticus]|uniref:lipocalin-like domain-containing protein n=1 Tax=Paenibacillus amylolyticus TaxID=1451 RepID=UPI003242D64D
MKLLSYDVNAPETKRTFAEEWAPHARQSEKSFEWWYMTAYVHDAQGNPYFMYVGVPDHVGDIMQTRLMGKTLPVEQRTIPITTTFSDYNADKVRTPKTLAIMNSKDIFNFEENKLSVADGNGTSLSWDYVGDRMKLDYECPEYIYDFTLTNASDGLWHTDKLGHEGMIQEGAEGDYSFYYSLTNCNLSGTVTLKDDKGNIEKKVEVTGRAWVDRQWGDYTTAFWEWSSFRFSNGATMHLYNFFNGHQEGLYRSADGTVQNFEGVTVRQNGYVKSKLAKAWTSWGWSYKFPIEIEGSKHYTVKPKSDKEFFEFPDMVVDLGEQKITGFALFEGAGVLINDETGEVVGVSINESADIRVMQNMPYGPNQK